MANTYANGLWRIDTLGQFWTGRAYIRRIDYYSNAAGDKIVITCNNQNVPVITLVGNGLAGGPATYDRFSDMGIVNPSVQSAGSGYLIVDVD